MKEYCISLALVFLFVACHSQPEPKEPQPSTSEQKSMPSLLLDKPLPTNDPYFIETTDTFSSHGPQSISRNILQDRKGNLWFATWEGIIRYDGKVFTNFTLKENLKHFHVFSVLEDKAGNIWFGTIRGGLYRFDGKTFKLFTTLDGLADNMVLCFLDDRSGNVWIGTDDGVSRFDGKSFTNFTTEDGLSGNSVNSIIQDKTGTIWFGTRGGVQNDVSYFNGKTFTQFTNQNGERFSNVRSIVEDKTGTIWIGSQDGLFRYEDQSLTTIATNFIGYIFEDKSENIWLSQGEENGMGLYRYDGKNSTRIVGGDQIFGIMEDKAGNIWFGTVDGVRRYDGKTITNFSDKSK